MSVPALPAKPSSSSKPESDTTPPSSFKKAFPQVERLVRLFKSRRDGRPVLEGPWTRIQLAVSEYEELERRLRRDEGLGGYVEDKVRYDYIPRSGQLILRMPSKLHDRFIGGVAEDIRAQLEEISNGSADSAAAEFARKVKDMRTGRVILLSDDPDVRPSRHEPDASFQHPGAQFPGVVLEVSYSQKRKDLARLADDYILDSDGSVRVVVGLDLEYRDSRRATLSVWRAGIVTNGEKEELMAIPTIRDEIFRNEHGNPTSSPGLQLQLRDFAHPEMTAALPSDISITVSASQLCLALSDAEEYINTEDPSNRSQAAGRHVLGPRVGKRRREETPPDKLTAEDEARMAELEEQADKRQKLKDEDFKPDSGESSFSSKG
ncbi:hypothetical protein H2199_009126 [Coniosporium tulheliwenetii]|uniref:Uncharacterized protein n=1 Tax=Coniosporium tulheliwenetii TaxID=3383036 RepID=A0ACC2YG10_9PEZI|nr:hypothetical protein H2199_009126 [Cladosporium sp. JES 115]